MIAITGGSGPLAHFLLPALLRSGRKLRVLVDPSGNAQVPDPQNSVLTDDRVESIEGSVFDIPILEILLDGCEEVWHLDRIDTFHPSDRSAMYRRNVVGTGNVVNVAQSSGVKKLLFASSIFSLGDKCDVSPYDESARWSDTRSATGYGWSMHLAEREVWRGVAEGLPALIVHTPVIASGPGFEWTSAEILRYCMNGPDASPPGFIHFMAPSDLTAVMLELMASGAENEAYICFSHQMDYRSFLEHVSRNFGRRPPGEVISYLSLKRRAFYRKLNFLNWHNKPMLSKSLARALADTRVFSNQKLLQATGHSFMDAQDVIERCCSMYAQQEAGI